MGIVKKVMKFCKGKHDEKHDKDGCEIMDPTPVALPAGFTRQPSLQEQIRKMVRSEQLRYAAQQMGAETFEEADDFDVGDDYDPKSPHELSIEQELEASPSRQPKGTVMTPEVPVEQENRVASKVPTDTVDKIKKSVDNKKGAPEGAPTTT